MEKICSKCKDKKDIEEFGFSRPNVRRSNCKKCQYEYTKQYQKDNPKPRTEQRIKYEKEYRQKNKVERNEKLKKYLLENPDIRRAQKYRFRYGIGIEDYDNMLIKQNGCCAICCSTDLGKKGAKYFIVDHCHETNKVRGLLCHKCNVLLGNAKDDINILNNAIDYINLNKL